MLSISAEGAEGVFELFMCERVRILDLVANQEVSDFRFS